MVSCACACSWRTFNWIFWAIHALISCVVLGLCVTTGNNINRTTFYGDNSSVFKAACCVLSFIVVFFFLVMSPIIMLGKLFGANLKLSYGVMLGSGWNAAWVVLLAGLVLNSSQDAFANGVWKSSDYSAYQSTYAFMYIACGSFIILIIALFFGRQALGPTEAYKPNADSGGAVGLQMQGTSTAPAGGPPSQWPPPSNQPAASGGQGAWSGWNGGTTV